MYTKFSVQDPVNLTPKCRFCNWMKAYNPRYGVRKHCYCEHSKAKSIFKQRGLKGDPAFIGFTEKFESKPKIKTSPRWCPMRFENIGV